VLLLVTLAGSRTDAQGRCPAGFSFVPRTEAGCVQDDCIAAGGVYDRAMRCTCESKACTRPIEYKRRARRRCKDHCPEQAIVACVAQGQTCPAEREVACKQDADCPACTYCKAGQCAQATALIATAGAPAPRGRRPAVGWRRSRVTFWPEKAWIARFLAVQGCRLAFGEIEDAEMLAERLAAPEVKALAYFGPCAERTVKKKAKDAATTDIFGRKRKPAAETRRQPTIEGMSAEELRDLVGKVLAELLADDLRRAGEKRAAAKKKAAEAAQLVTQNGWLHTLLNSTCHSLDDTSMPDTLVRPGGIYFGRKGTAPAGVPLTRHEKPE
jgi:hypothetical protein